MTQPDIWFEEKQYLGHNRLSMVIRTAFTLFCFLGYYWSQNPKPVEYSFFHIGSYPLSPDNSGTIFFILGTCILILSASLTFVLHIHTKVYNGYMVLDGFWTSRKVKIDFSSIASVRLGKYKKNVFRRAVYNLHNQGIIRFYTSGEDFLEMTDKTGFEYRIGSQKIQELYHAVVTSMNNP